MLLQGTAVSPTLHWCCPRIYSCSTNIDAPGSSVDAFVLLNISSSSSNIDAALESTLVFLLLCEESASVVNNKGIDSGLALHKNCLFSLLLLSLCHWLKQLGWVFEKVNQLFFFFVLALHAAAQVAYGSGIGLAEIASICATCERIWQSPGNLHYIQVCAPIEQGAWRPCRWRNMEARRRQQIWGLLLGKSALTIRPRSTTDWKQMRRRPGNKSSNDLWTNPDVI